MPRSSDRPQATRAVARVACAAVLLLLGGCVSTAAEPSPMSRDEWMMRTAHLLEQSIGAEDGTPVLVLPSVGASDTYVMALAISALGDRAGEVLEWIGFADDRAHFDRGLTPEALAAGYAGPVFTAREVVRADATVDGLLEDGQKAVLAGVVDDALADRDTEWTAFDALYLREVAQALGGPEDRVRAWAADVARGLALDCRADDHLRDLGALSAVSPALVDCPVADLAATWDRVADRIAADLAGDEAVAYLGYCEDLVALARIQHHHWPDDRQRRTVVATLFDRMTALVAQARVEAPLQCVGGGLRGTADLLGTDLVVPDYLVGYAAAVLGGGGEPHLLRLDASGWATVLRIARMTGASIDVDAIVGAPILSSAGPAHRLDLMLASRPGGEWTTEFADLVDKLKTEASRDTLAASVLTRAMLAGGPDACGSPAVDTVRSLAGPAGSGRPAAAGDLAIRAQAVRVVQRCGLPSDDAAAAVVERARAVLGRLDDGQPPDLLQAADAVSALCLLDPAALPDPDLRWRAYADQAAENGGSVDPAIATVSVARTYALTVIAAATTPRCEAGEVF